MSSRSTSRIVSVAVAVLIAGAATACTGATGAISDPSAGSSDAPVATPTSVPTLDPTPDLGPFACALPVSGEATTSRAQIVGIRVGTHDGYDRVVFEFTDGIPAYTVSAATPPFVHDPSGLPLTVQGSAFLQLTLDGGTKMMPDGTSSYDGSTDFTPGYSKLVQMVESGDFEALSTWYVGMSDSSCIRVLTLDGPPRLVIDVEH